MDGIWSAALPLLRERVGERNFSVWIEPIRCVGENGTLRLEVPSRFSQEWVSQHFLATICEVVKKVAGAPFPVRLALNPQPPPNGRFCVPAGRAVVSTRPAQPRDPIIGQLMPHYTFRNFVVGVTNEVAVRAAQTVSAAPGRRFNPLFLHSGVGLGKTHLLNAIGHELLRRWPRIRIAWLPAETFMNDMIASIRKEKMNTFRERYRQADAILLDDVQTIANKERTQEEFFHTFNSLYGSGKQIVVTSDKPPAEIEGLENRLRSRFEGGLLADIQPPTREMRAAIIRAKAAELGAEMPPEVVDLIAERDVPSVRTLEGALKRVVAAATVSGKPITLEMARSTLAPWLRAKRTVSVEAIQKAVSEHYGIRVTEMLSHRRDQRVVFPRQVAMYLSRSLADAALCSIGDKFGGRDHTTVMHAVRVVAQKREADPEVARSLAAIEHQLQHSAETVDAGR